MIRLELASSRDFPRGSASRSYLIRLPLADDGVIDTATLQSHPARATVRRFWPNEADILGYVENTPQGYAIRYETNGAPKPTKNSDLKGRCAQQLFQFAAEAIRVGEKILLTEPDGRQLPFRIASLH